jgi:hypothetical protein
MALGLRDGKRLERRRRRARMATALLVLGSLVGLGFMAYQSGAALVRLEVADLEGDVRNLRAQVAGLNARVAEVEAARQAALTREAATEARYRREVPTGPARDLFLLMQDRMAKGMTPERLAFVISNTTEGKACDNRPVTKRFIARTPQVRGSNDWVGFEGSTVTVTAEAEPATNDQGAPFSWFDPAKPVRVIFTQLGGAKSEVEGVLPLHHALVRGANEFRFAITAGEARGFIQVTADRCDYP